MKSKHLISNKETEKKQAENTHNYSQSPVMITHCKSIYNEEINLNPLIINYIPSKFTCTNDGQTIKWEFIKSKEKTVTPTVNGGLGNQSNEYKLLQFHMHWGPSDEIGSEHYVNDEAYSGEIHLVHWNSLHYQNADVAMNESDGILVLAVFFQVLSNLSDKIENNIFNSTVIKFYYFLLIFIKFC